MVKPSAWSNNLKQRHGKRQRLYEEIKIKASQMQMPANEMPDKMRKAAEDMDEERKSLDMTLVQYSDHVRQDKIRKRKKRRETRVLE